MSCLLLAFQFALFPNLQPPGNARDEYVVVRNLNVEKQVPSAAENFLLGGYCITKVNGRSYILFDKCDTIPQDSDRYIGLSESIKYFSDRLKNNPNDWQAYILRAHSHSVLGNPKQSLIDLANAERLYSALKEHNFNYEILKIRTLNNNEEVERAFECIDALTEREKNSPVLMRELFRISVLCNRLDESIFIAERAAKISPCMKNHLAVSSARFLKGDYAGVISYCSKLKSKDHPILMAYLAQSYSLCEDHKAALLNSFMGLLSNISCEYSTRIIFYDTICRSLVSLKRFDELIRFCDYICRMAPLEPLGFHFKAIVLVSQKKHAEAVQCYKRLLILDPTSDLYSYELCELLTCSSVLGLKDIKQANAIAEQMLTRNPECCRAMAIKALIYAETDWWDRAGGQIQLAIRKCDDPGLKAKWGEIEKQFRIAQKYKIN